MKQALVVTFSPIEFDSRVRRQISALADNFNVTVFLPKYSEDLPFAQLFVLDWKDTWRQTTGKGPGKLTRFFATVVYRIRQTLRVVGLDVIADRLPFGFQWSARKLLKSQPRTFDLIIANDAETLPLAFKIGQGARVVADLHEYATGQTRRSSIRDRAESRYLGRICKKYLPKCFEVSVVGQGIADLYRANFGVECSVLPSMPNYVDLEPTAVEASNIKLVHHGIYTPNRGIELLISALGELPNEFSLHLVLTRAPIEALTDFAMRLGISDERIRFYEFVPPDELAAFLNQFDIEVIFVPPNIINHRLGLPNKFFEAVQARLAVVSGPTIEIEKQINAHGIGLTTASFDSSELARVLRGLTPEKILKWKLAASDVASVLNWEAIKPDYLSFVD